jgi:serine/threonine protein kinase
MSGKTGSYRFMAPEVYLESDIYTAKVDVYSASLGTDSEKSSLYNTLYSKCTRTLTFEKNMGQKPASIAVTDFKEQIVLCIKGARDLPPQVSAPYSSQKSVF